jgi:UPF0755 protein
MFKLLFRLVLAVIVVALAGVAVARLGWTRIHEPYKGFAGAEQFVEIPQGASSADIRRRLIDAGVVKDDVAFRAALWWSGAARSLKAGEYLFDEPLTPLQVIEKLERGDVYARRITFPEGLTIREMAAIFEATGLGSARDFITAAGDETLIADLDPGATDLEGYLFPDTYDVPRGTAAPRLIDDMVRRFKSTYSSIQAGTTEKQGLTTREVVTLASLVEKETGRADERPMVAGVYRNRLNIGMPMQADPTVVFALAKAGKYDGNIRRDDLDFDSRYNTYRYPGLPPGPIAAPGKASLEAALAPAPVKYLYFVSRNDGSHVFAETLAEHNLNVQQYQVLFFRRQRELGRVNGTSEGGNGTRGRGGR